MEATYILVKVLRPQQEFKSREVGHVFTVDSTRLIATADGKWALPNPAAIDPAYMGPKSIAIFEKVSQ